MHAIKRGADRHPFFGDLRLNVRSGRDHMVCCATPWTVESTQSNSGAVTSEWQ